MLCGRAPRADLSQRISASPSPWLLASFIGSSSFRRILGPFLLGPQIPEDAPSRPGVVLLFVAEASGVFSLSYSNRKPVTFLVYEVGGNIGKFPDGK